MNSETKVKQRPILFSEDINEAGQDQIITDDDIEFPPEEWRAVVGYEGKYEISSFGKIRIVNSVVRKYRGQLMKPTPNKKGYLVVSLYNNGHKNSQHVHRIVAAAFIGECPKGKQVAHNDGDPSNNHVSNLRYATPLENIADRGIHGRSSLGSRQPQSKIDEIKAGIIYKLRNSGISSTELSLLIGLSSTNIQRIWNKKLWKHAI